MEPAEQTTYTTLTIRKVDRRLKEKLRLRAAQHRRFTRLTDAFSKKVENLQAAVALHFAHYNFVRIHLKHRVRPAMAAGVSNRVWGLEELVTRTSA